MDNCEDASADDAEPLVFAVPLPRLDTAATASPKSSQLSLLLSTTAAAAVQRNSVGVSSGSSSALAPPSDGAIAAGTRGGSLADPTVSFRIRNYSAADLSTAADAPPPAAPPPPPAAAVAAASARRRVGVEDFERLRVIGQGGYGKVFLVRQHAASQLYAMKVLKKATLVIHTKTVEHTKNERDILSQLAHPFIVKLHYAFQTPERLYLILQYAPGGELFSHLSAQRLFDEDTAAFYIAELVCAIEHLHSLGIIYRDLKPENVLLDAEGHVLLTDFGLSKVALGGSTRTVCGTVEFTAPEVLSGTTDYGPGVDHWSLGVMLYDMLTGSPPFPGNSRNRVMQAILTKKVTFPVYVTSYARDLITKLLKKDPIQRIGYMGDASAVPTATTPSTKIEKNSATKSGRSAHRRANSAGKDATSGGSGAQQIKAHSFFRKLNWAKLERRQLEPPIVPTVSDATDTSNFDACFTDMPVESPPARAAWVGPQAAPQKQPQAKPDAALLVLSPLPSTADAVAGAGSSGANSSVSATPTLTGRKKYKAKKKAEAIAAATAAAAASAAASPAMVALSPNVLLSDTGSPLLGFEDANTPTMPVFEAVSSEISLEINDVPVSLNGVAIPEGNGDLISSEGDVSPRRGIGLSSGSNGNHFYGFSYVADDGFLGKNN